MSAFRLPRDCIHEIDKICSAFLWSGADLSSTKAKIAWEDVCKPLQEGLGLRSLKEANDVCCLKLIWRIVSNQASLWVTWAKKNLLKHAPFWVVKSDTTNGSWIWRKLLKYRDMAKTFCKVKLGNGQSTSFWYDRWSDLGYLVDNLGARGIIDLGIHVSASVADAVKLQRRRRHRQNIINEVEKKLLDAQQCQNVEAEDEVQWRGKGDKYSPLFSTKETWNHIRARSITVDWARGIWFPHGTPKFAFCSWLASRDRLPTGARQIGWNLGIDSSCIFCSGHIETRDHLFFGCRYSTEIWSNLTQQLLSRNFSTNWEVIIKYISAKNLHRVHAFLIRYVFQATIHTIWRERNVMKHDTQSRSALTLIKIIDRQVRNQLLSIRRSGDTRLEYGLQTWLSTRI